MIKSRGFTLIETMAVLAIVAILTRMAYLSYQSSLLQGNRSSAQAAMMDIAQTEQQYLLDSRSYEWDGVTLSMASPTVPGGNYTLPTAVSQYYTVSISAPASATPPVFTITATPIPGSMQASDPTLTLNQSGSKTPSTVW